MQRLLILLLLLLPRWPDRAGDGSGFSYEHRTTNAPHSMHILVVDPNRMTIRAERALNDGVGRETVSSMATRGGAFAAINGGFFRIGGRYDGEPDGILKIRDKWFSDPSSARGAVGWRDGGRELLIGRLSMKWTVQIGGKSHPVDGINRPRESSENVLYDWAFHRSTLTDPGGLEIGIAGNKIASVAEGGDALIPVNGFVYSIGQESPLRKERPRIGAPARVSFALVPADSSSAGLHRQWERMDFIVGGVPVLIRDGRINPEWAAEKARQGFAEERHPRTAVGLRPDGRWVFLVVDGRQPSLSVGMTLVELADTMLSLGCGVALNLDGGGSSTFWLQGRVMNSPSDSGKERPVSDAFLIFPRPAPR